MVNKYVSATPGHLRRPALEFVQIQRPGPSCVASIAFASVAPSCRSRATPHQFGHGSIELLTAVWWRRGSLRHWIIWSAPACAAMTPFTSTNTLKLVGLDLQRGSSLRMRDENVPPPGVALKSFQVRSVRKRTFIKRQGNYHICGVLDLSAG